MTTAARPTFEPARGGQGRGEKDLSAISRQYSSRDLPSHNKLKYRYKVILKHMFSGVYCTLLVYITFVGTYTYMMFIITLVKGLHL
jgi:hypothetical protein